MSKSRSGAPKRVAAGLLAGALAVFGVAAAPSAGADTVDEVVDACGRLAGQTRFGTAGAIGDAYATEAGEVDTAIIANGRNFPDALAASGLARTLGAPILLVEPPDSTDSVPLETQSALDELGVTNIVIVGGTAAVSDAVEAELEERYGDARRVAGDLREDTAAEIAAEIGTAGSYNDLVTAIVATGDNYPDALAGGPVAYNGDGTNPFPILLTRGSDVPDSTEAALADLGIEQVIVLGGTAAVPAETVTELETITGNDAIVLAGNLREDTAKEVADFAVDELGFDLTTALIADGREHFPSPDALTGGPLGGITNSPILLVTPETLPPATETFLTDRAPLEQVIALGGTAAVSAEVLEQACTAAGTPLEGPPGTVALDNRSVAPGGTITGTVTGNNIQSVTVSGCGLNNQAIADDNATSADDRDFTLTIPGSQPAGECTLTFTITDDDGTRTETETITVTTRSGTATIRPELVSASIVQTVLAGNATPTRPIGTYVTYTFDEPVGTAAANLPANFKVYYSDGTLADTGDAAVTQPGGTTVEVRFDAVDLTSEATRLSLATVVVGAVTDNQGNTNPEGDAAIGSSTTSALTSGSTTAPDLLSVSGFRQGAGVGTTAVDFTFDEAATVLNTGGFSLVTTNNTPVACTASTDNTQPSGGTVAGGSGTTVITAICTNTGITPGNPGGTPLSTANIARGAVDTAAVQDAGADANPLETADAGNGGNTSGPDLVSATLSQGTDFDRVLYVFDSNVTTTGAAGLFNAYLADSSEVNPTACAISGTDAKQVLCTFAAPTTLDNAVGASVEPAAVTDATGPNERDEVAVSNANTTTLTPGRTAAPDLVSVAVAAATGFQPATATYTFDQNVDAAADIVEASFNLYTADGALIEATQCSRGTSATADSATSSAVVTCFFSAATGAGGVNAQVINAVLGTVEAGAVQDETSNVDNPEGAELTTGGSGTPTA